jgi:hypothetical protein
MKYFIHAFLVIMTSCTSCAVEKLIEDTGVHLEMEIDKPSDLPPCSKIENQPKV